LLLTLFQLQDIRSGDLQTEVCQVLNGYKQVHIGVFYFIGFHFLIYTFLTS